MQRTFLIFLAFCGFFYFLPLTADSPNSNNQYNKNKTLTIYFFWKEGCPHCTKAKPFLNELKEKYPQIQIEAFEIKHSPENKELAKKMAAEHGFAPTVVPTIFIEDDYFEGFNAEISQKIEESVKKHLHKEESPSI